MQYLVEVQKFFDSVFIPVPVCCVDVTHAQETWVFTVATLFAKNKNEYFYFERDDWLITFQSIFWRTNLITLLIFICILIEYQTSAGTKFYACFRSIFMSRQSSEKHADTPITPRSPALLLKKKNISFKKEVMSYTFPWNKMLP